MYQVWSNPPVLSNLVQKQDHKQNFRYANLLQIPQVKSSRYCKSSFRYAAPVLWNSLPDNYRNCSNFNEFKNIISFWNGKSCTCICQNSQLFVPGQYTKTISVLLFIFLFYFLLFCFTLSFYLCALFCALLYCDFMFHCIMYYLLCNLIVHA